MKKNTLKSEICKFKQFQAVVGTVISAMTGTTDPHEVAKMAKQAVQVSIYSKWLLIES